MGQWPKSCNNLSVDGCSICVWSGMSMLLEDSMITLTLSFLMGACGGGCFCCCVCQRHILTITPSEHMDSPLLGNFSTASHCWELGGGSDVLSHVPNLLLLANLLKGKEPRGLSEFKKSLLEAHLNFTLTVTLRSCAVASPSSHAFLPENQLRWEICSPALLGFCN